MEILKKSELKNGEVTVFLRDCITDKTRLADGFYKKDLNAVFFIHREYEEIIGYIQ